MDQPLTSSERDALQKRIKRIPIVEFLSLQLARLERGECVLEMARDRRYDGIFESLHGGLLATLADSAATFAALSLTGADTKITTIEMSTRFLRPALGRVSAKAKVLKAGRSLAFCTVDVTDENGRLLVHSAITYMILGQLAGKNA